jgi:hypothetical protein
MFKDFAAYRGTMTDPALTGFAWTGGAVASGGVGQPWTRPYVSFFPDHDAVFLGVGARVEGLTLASLDAEPDNSQYLTNWQLERAPYSTWSPTAYSPAREVQVGVKPDRMNRMVNGGMELFANMAPYGNMSTGWNLYQGASTGITLATHSTDGVTSGVRAQLVGATAVNTNGYLGMWKDAAINPGPAYVSADIRKNLWPVSGYDIQVMVLPLTALGGSQVGPAFSALGTALAPVVNGKIQFEFEVPEGANAVRVLIFAFSTGGTGQSLSFIVDSVFVDNGGPATYFDGTFGDDYVWENSASAHTTRSFYYENRLDRMEAIRRATRDAIPLGIGVGEPKFGVWAD